MAVASDARPSRGLWIASALMLAMTAGPWGCGGADDPTLAAARFASAARRGQGVTILPLLTKESRAMLSEEAERASNQIGDRRSVEPFEMLQIVDVPALDGRRRPELTRREGDRATVVLFALDGTEYPVALVLEDGAWRVPLLEGQP